MMMWMIVDDDSDSDENDDDGDENDDDDGDDESDECNLELVCESIPIYTYACLLVHVLSRTGGHCHCSLARTRLGLL